jgi:hypothetical protein
MELKLIATRAIDSLITLSQLTDHRGVLRTYLYIPLVPILFAVLRKLLRTPYQCGNLLHCSEVQVIIQKQQIGRRPLDPLAVFRTYLPWYLPIWVQSNPYRKDRLPEPLHTMPCPPHPVSMELHHLPSCHILFLTTSNVISSKSWNSPRCGHGKSLPQMRGYNLLRVLGPGATYIIRQPPADLLRPRTVNPPTTVNPPSFCRPASITGRGTSNPSTPNCCQYRTRYPLHLPLPTNQNSTRNTPKVLLRS